MRLFEVFEREFAVFKGLKNHGLNWWWARPLSRKEEGYAAYASTCCYLQGKVFMA